MWTTVKSARSEGRDVDPQTYTGISVKHESFELLDIDGSPCTLEEDFNYDECISGLVRQKQMEKFGCTSPFLGKIKDNVCTNQTIGVQAYKIQNDFFSNGVHEGFLNCFEACNYLSIEMRDKRKSTNNSKHATLRLTFQEKIKKTKSYFAYEALSLVAEIGGYVGLFLGVSIYNSSYLIERFLLKLN